MLACSAFIFAYAKTRFSHNEAHDVYHIYIVLGQNFRSLCWNRGHQLCFKVHEPSHEKTFLWGFQLGPT